MGGRTLPAALALRRRVFASHRRRRKVLRPAGTTAACLFCGEIQCLAPRLATLESLAIAMQPRREQEEGGPADPEDRAGVFVRRHGDELRESVKHRHPRPLATRAGTSCFTAYRRARADPDKCERRGGVPRIIAAGRPERRSRQRDPCNEALFTQSRAQRDAQHFKCDF